MWSDLLLVLFCSVGDIKAPYLNASACRRPCLVVYVRKRRNGEEGGKAFGNNKKIYLIESSLVSSLNENLMHARREATRREEEELV